MARNDIKFAQAQQADFAQANQMILQAQQQYNNAIKNAQDTVTAFDKAVTARTTAKAKEMINQLSLQDWQDNARREQLQQDLTDYANSVGNMIDAKALQEHQQNNLKRLYDDENAGLEYQTNQNTLTKDNLLVKQKEYQDGITDATAQATAFDNEISKYAQGTDEHTKALQAKDEFLASLNPVVRLGVQDNLDARELQTIKHNTDVLTAQDKHSQASILEQSSMLPYLAEQITQNTNLLERYSQLPDEDPRKEALVSTTQAQLEKLQGMVTRIQSTVPINANGHFTSAFVKALDDRKIQNSKLNGTDFDRAKLEEQVRQFEKSHELSSKNAEVTRAVQLSNAQNTTAKTTADIASQQVADAIKISEATNPQAKSNSKSNSKDKDGKVSVVLSSINDKGELIIPNLKNNIHHAINTIKSSTNTVDAASYKRFLLDDYPKIQSQQSGLTEIANGLNGSKKELEVSVDNYRKPDKKPLTNAEKQYVLSKIASGSIGYFSYRRDQQITDALRDFEVDSNNEKSTEIKKLLVDIVAELASQNYGQEKLASILKETVPVGYYKELPEPYNTFLTSSKVSEVINSKTSRANLTKSTPTNNSANNAGDITNGKSTTADSLKPTRMYLLSR